MRKGRRKSANGTEKKRVFKWRKFELKCWIRAGGWNCLRGFVHKKVGVQRLVVAGNDHWWDVDGEEGN